MGTNRAARRGDLCSGHQESKPRPARSGSADVSVNDRPALRAGDAFGKHGPTPHEGKVTGGSSTVSFNDQPAARSGDSIDCGSAIDTGSGDVFVGD